MSHTPGPWEYRKAGKFVHGEPGHEESFYVPDHVVSIITDDQGRKVTRFVAQCSATTLPNADNARLIAAVPDLLDAAYDALGQLQHPAKETAQLVQRRLRSAIAKAASKEQG